jgi:hypothetical protein
LEVWKYLWLLWLIGLAAHIVRSKDFFDKKGGGSNPSCGYSLRSCLFSRQFPTW